MICVVSINSFLIFIHHFLEFFGNIRKKRMRYSRLDSIICTSEETVDHVGTFFMELSVHNASTVWEQSQYWMDNLLFFSLINLMLLSPLVTFPLIGSHGINHTVNHSIDMNGNTLRLMIVASRRIHQLNLKSSSILSGSDQDFIRAGRTSSSGTSFGLNRY